MRNLFLPFMLAVLTLSVVGCSNKKNESSPIPLGLYEVSQTDSKSQTYLRLESDRVIRYVIQKESQTYYWEVLQFDDSKLNGPLKLVGTTCHSPNSDKVGQIIENLSDSNLTPVENGFLLSGIFFRKIPSNDEEKIISQLSIMSYECSKENEEQFQLPPTNIQEKIAAAPAVLSAKLIEANSMPILSGKVLKKLNNLKDFEYYIVFSDKAYITYLYNENDPDAVNDNLVSWNYGELLDDELTGRTQKLKNSCPPNHPLATGLGKIQKASKNKLEETDSIDPLKKDTVKIGEETYKVLTIDEWAQIVSKISSAKIVCNASVNSER